jgi:ElaB/YqjD/DUF883 family membrane-anchored ribosome-binding protein
MSKPVEQQSIENAGEQIAEKSKAQIEAELKEQVDKKIDIIVKKLVKKIGPIAQQYEDTLKKVAKRLILNIPIIGEAYAAVLDFLDTFDTFVDNLEPTLESLLLVLQLLNLELHVDKESGEEHVSTLEALEKLLAGTLSDTKKRNLQMVLNEMKKLRNVEKMVKDKVNATVNSELTSVGNRINQGLTGGENRVNQGLPNVQENNKGAADSLNRRIDQTATSATSAARGGGKKRTSTRTRRIKRGTRRSPLAKSKVVKRSTRRRARRSMRV